MGFAFQRAGRAVTVLCIACIALFALTSRAADSWPTAKAQDSDGSRIAVLSLDVHYRQGDLPLPSIKSILADATVKLAATQGGLTAAHEDQPKTARTVTLAQINQIDGVPDRIFYKSAIDAIVQSVDAEMAKRGYPGAKVSLGYGQFDEQGADTRAAGDQALHIVIDVPESKVDASEPRYPVMELELRYSQGREGLPKAYQLLATPVKLGDSEGGMHAPAKGLDDLQFQLANFHWLPDRIFYKSAIDEISKAVELQMERLGYAGATVAPAPGQFDSQGNDIRAAGDQDLVLIINTDNIQNSALAIKRTDGGWYPVTSIQLSYEPQRESLPAADKLMQTPVKLGQTEVGFVGARDDVIAHKTTIGQLNDQPEVMLFASGIRSVSQSLVSQLNDDGLVGVVVLPAPGQFDNEGNDLRPANDHTLKLVIRPGIVTEVRTSAVGDRFGADDKANNPAHRRIARLSPIGPDADSDVLDREVLDRYVYWLNRHPGRNINAAVTAGSTPGSFALDYMVQENKPWTLYAQMSNTGTKQTDQWRERFGFVDNQLTNNDDILHIDYITSGFDSSHAVVGSYEAPVGDFDRLRYKVTGLYSEFVASDVGLFGEQFKGDEWSVDGELSLNVFQDRDFFVDVFGGLKYEEVSIDNELLQTNDAKNLIRPRAGVRMQRLRRTDTFVASASVDHSINGIDDPNPNVTLGRLNADTSWTLAQAQLSASTYIEPLLAGVSGNNVPVAMLTHEIAVNAQGQYVFNDTRVIPQAEQVAGGFYTVRGYDESASVGDNVFLVSAEYRYHVARALGLADQPGTLFGQPFAFRSTNEYVAPDWDLILRGFVDYGHTANNERLGYEHDNDLLGAGVGVELQLKRNFNIRVDWAMALKDVPGVNQEGDSRFHIVGTLLY